MIRSVLLAAFCFASPVSAAVFSRDLFELGDGLLTYDDVNQREWLDFSVTSGMSRSELIDQLQTAAYLYGFRLAEAQDVEDLIFTRHYPDEPIEEPDWIALLGAVEPFDFAVPTTGGHVGFGDDAAWEISPNPVWSIILPDQNTITSGRRFGMVLVIQNAGHFDPPAGLSDPPTDSYWLYRDATPVPEPATVAIALALSFVAPSRLRVRPLTNG